MATYRVMHASIVRNMALLRVLRVDDEPLVDFSPQFHVVEETDKVLMLQSARLIYDKTNKPTQERIFTFSRPEFDVTPLIGKRIQMSGSSSSTQ